MQNVAGETRNGGRGPVVSLHEKRVYRPRSARSEHRSFAIHVSLGCPDGPGVGRHHSPSPKCRLRIVSMSFASTAPWAISLSWLAARGTGPNCPTAAA